MLSFFLLITIGCAFNSKIVEPTKDDNKIEKFDWSNMSPIDFLELLENRGEAWVTIWENPPNGWIKAEHIHELIKYIESKEKSAFVISSLSSYLPPGSSTVGNEAMYLINGYRNNKYPPSLYSGVGNIEKTKEWYQNWVKENKTP